MPVLPELSASELSWKTPCVLRILRWLLGILGRRADTHWKTEMRRV